MFNVNTLVRTPTSTGKNMYIKPRFKIYDNFEALKLNEPYIGSYFGETDTEDFENLINYNRLIILAEPGYGKSELLKEINKKSKNSIIVELKKFEGEATLKLFIDKLIKAEKLSFNFDGNEDKLICLDALDEVKNHLLEDLIIKINGFANEYSNVKIFMTSRILYYERYRNYFRGIDAKYLRLHAFENYQIKEYLKNNNLTEAQIDQLNRNFIKGWNYVIIQTPRYLNLLVNYVLDKGFNDLSFLNRISLMDYFIYSKLDKEDSTTNKQNKEYTKRVLEKLALTMEIYQTNIISKDELMTFFDDIDSKIVTHFLSIAKVDEFFDKSLLKNNLDSIEFENSEFQEYLAAKELSRLRKFEQSIFDVSVDPVKREIYPKWFNVLSYAVEFKIEILNEVLSFGFINNTFIDKEYFQLITNANLNRLDDSIKDAIFQKVFYYHQEKNLRIEIEIAKNLSFYYLVNHFSILKTNYIKSIKNPKRFFIQLVNIFTVINEYLERNVLDHFQIKEIKNYLLHILQNEKYPLSLKRNLMYTAQYLKDNDLIFPLKELTKNTVDDTLSSSIIIICTQINPNSKDTLDLILSNLKNENIQTHTYYGLSLITNRDTFMILLQELLNDDELLESFYKVESDRESDRLFENLKNVFDDELGKLISELYFKSNVSDYSYYAHRSKLLRSIGLFLFEKDETFIYSIIDKIKVSSEVGLSYWRVIPMFDKMLTEQNVKPFINYAQIQLDNGNELAANVLTSRYYLNDEKQKRIYEIGREYFPQFYKEFEDNVKRHQQVSETRKKESNDISYFRQLINISTNEKFHTQCFYEFVNNHEEIEKLWSIDEKKRFIDLLNHILTIHDPGTTDLFITNADANGSTYRTHKWNQFYAECIKSADILKINISNMRQNIINFIPFAFWDTLLVIFKLTLPMSENELGRLSNIYFEKKDDLWQFKPDNYFETLSRNKSYLPSIQIIKEFVELEFIKDPKFLMDYRLKALRLSQQYIKDKKYFISIFNKYQNSKVETENLAIVANEILITKFSDDNAIKWRLKEIFNRKFRHSYQMGGSYSISKEEDELSSKTFAYPLFTIRDEKYLNLYVDLLIKSFRITKKDKTFFNYSIYMREIVLKYFDNLKCYKNYKYLDLLEKECKQLVNFDGISHFVERFNSIKMNYLNFIGKPDSYSDCIRKYNSIKQSDYLNISTSHDLFEVVKDLILNTLNKWIIGEGQKLLLQYKSNNKINETSLQKLLKIKLESILFEKGFRFNEVKVYREIQSLDDSRPDFLITYGFVEPVLIEIKLSSNKDLHGNKLKEKKSYKNLVRYINNFKVSNAIFLIYDDKLRKNKTSWSTCFKKIENCYGSIKDVSVIGIPNIYE